MKNLILTVILALFSITLFSQTDISGTWNTGDQNTLVKIEKVNTLIDRDGKKRAFIKFSMDTPAIDVATKLGLI